jgi:hypothetical protein
MSRATSLPSEYDRYVTEGDPARCQRRSAVAADRRSGLNDVSRFSGSRRHSELVAGFWRAARFAVITG